MSGNCAQRHLLSLRSSWSCWSWELLSLAIKMDIAAISVSYWDASSPEGIGNKKNVEQAI